MRIGGGSRGVSVDEIERRLSRIGGRIEAQKRDVSAELERVGLLGPVAKAREVFAGRLTWLKTDRIEIGREPEAGVVPAPYQRRVVDAKTGKVTKGDRK